MLVRDHLKSSSSESRPLMAREKPCSYLVFGAWVRGGLCGVTSGRWSTPRFADT